MYLMTNSTAGVNVRCNRADVGHLAALQTTLANKMVKGSMIKAAWAFNGAGIDEHGGFVSDELVTATRQYCANFEWLSHTFRHTNLNNVTYAEALDEMTQNEVCL